MMFFDQTEQDYFADFLAQHQHIVKTYCFPHESLEAFICRIRYDSYKYYYFFMQGVGAFLNAALSLCKSIYALVTLSFTDATFSIIACSNYLASSIAKHAFLLLTLCLDLLQQLSKLLFGFFFLLIIAISEKSENRHKNSNQETLEKLDIAQRSFDRKTLELDEILTIISEKSGILRNYKDRIDPQLVKNNSLKLLNDATCIYKKIYLEFQNTFVNFFSHFNKRIDLETFEEHMIIFDETHSLLMQSAITAIKYLDFLLKLHEDVLSQSKLAIQLI